MNVFELKEGVLLAFDSLRANKFRAFLTIVGVTIGTASVIAVASIIASFKASVEGQIEQWGSNMISVTKFPPNTNWRELSEEERKRDPITIKEAEWIKEYCPSVDGVAPQNFYFRPGGNVAKYKDNRSENFQLFGTTTDWELVRNRYAARGRFFIDEEDHDRAMVCVIGPEVADVLFKGDDPLGKQILMNDVRLRVIGVLENQESSFGNNNNNLIILPYGTYEKLYPWEKELWLNVRAESAEKVDQAKDEIREVLRRFRGVRYNEEDNFALFTQKSATEMFDSLIKVIVWVVLGICSIGLLVGGIGVLNIMLVSVTERTREIGVRKAIGARRRNVFFQFLIEAMTMTGTGGVVGILVGYIIGLIVAGLLSLPLVIPIKWIVIAFAVSVGVGLISGLAPAWRAASVDPIVSLRYE
jgi:putative ABC transport system permease protein